MGASAIDASSRKAMLVYTTVIKYAAFGILSVIAITCFIRWFFDCSTLAEGMKLAQDTAVLSSTQVELTSDLQALVAKLLPLLREHLPGMAAVPARMVSDATGMAPKAVNERLAEHEHSLEVLGRGLRQVMIKLRLK